MSKANKCDACGKLYVVGTEEDLDARPTFEGKLVFKRKLISIDLNSGNEDYKVADLCPDCAHKVADVFSETDIFVKPKEEPEPEPVEPPTEEEKNLEPTPEEGE